MRTRFKHDGQVYLLVEDSTGCWVYDSNGTCLDDDATEPVFKVYEAQVAEQAERETEQDYLLEQEELRSLNAWFNKQRI